MSKILKGTMILLVAGLITRLLGFVNRMVIARFIGDEGVGLYMMAFPTLMLVIVITQLGIPVAISKNVSEATARGDHRKVKRILVVSLTTTITLSILLTPALAMLAPIISQTLFTDSRTYLPLLAMTPIIPVVAVSSVLRGYFQGRQNMTPHALSQVLEQFARITLIAVMTKAFLPYGIEYAAAGAMLASVAGELISLIYLVASFKLKQTFRVRKKFFKQVKEGKQEFKELMSVGLPTTGSRLIGSVAWALEPMIVAHSMVLAGFSTITATKQYGALTGLAIPLLFLPSFITSAISTSLLPAISEANANNNQRLIEYRLRQALRVVIVTGGLAVVVLYIVADPLLELMYGSTNASYFIKLMAPFFIFSYIQGPLQATLQALNLAKAAMVNSLIGNIVKSAVIFLLASQAAFGINGAAIGIIVGILLVTLLHFATVIKKISFTIYVGDYVKTFFTMGVSGWFGWLLTSKVFLNESLLINVLLTSFGISAVYLTLTLLFGLITKDELRRVPKVGGFLSRFALR